MPQFAAASGAGLLSARPTPGANHEGQLYFGTDTGILYRWDGAAWQNNSLVTAGGDLTGSYPNPEVFQIAQTLQLRQDVNSGALNTSQNNYAPPGGSTATIYRIDLSNAIEISGLSGGNDGRILIIENISAFNLLLRNEDTSSTAANRFGFTSPLTLAPKEAALLCYDATRQRWFCVATYNPSASGSGVTSFNTRTGAVTLSSSDVTAALTYTPTNFAAINSPSSLSANQNDYDPDGTGTNAVYRLTTSANINITGLARGVDGRVVTLLNIGSNVIQLLSENTSSTAANRFGFGATDYLGGAIKYSIPALGSVSLIYDGTSSRWRMLSNPAAGRLLTYKDADSTEFLSIDGRSNSAFIDAHGYGLTLNFQGFFKLAYGGGNQLLYSPDGTHLEIYPNASGDVPLILFGKSGQSVDLTQWKNDTPTLLLSVTKEGHLAFQQAGLGLKIKEGSNARMGVATLVAGTVVVSNTSVTANTRIFLTDQGGGVNIGSVGVTARTAGTSFTITSSNPLDTSDVAWLLIEPS